MGKYYNSSQSEVEQLWWCAEEGNLDFLESHIAGYKQNSNHIFPF